MNNAGKSENGDNRPSTERAGASSGDGNTASPQQEKNTASPVGGSLNRLWNQYFWRPIGKFIEWFDAHDGAVTAVSTAFIAAFTIVLAIYAGGQGDISARQTTILDKQRGVMQRTLDEMQAEQRPFVTVDGLTITIRRDTIGNVTNWEVHPDIQNAGNTPTRDAEFFNGTDSGPVFDGLENGLRLWIGADDPDGAFNGPFFRQVLPLGPKARILDMPGAGGSADDLAYHARQTCRLIVWGVIHYRDFVRADSQHVTKYCFVLLTNPTMKGSEIQYQRCPYWNCTDEECAEDKATYDRQGPLAAQLWKQQPHPWEGTKYGPCAFPGPK